VTGQIVWATLIFPTLQLAWVGLVPVCGRHFLSESLGAFPELQDRIKKYPQYFLTSLCCPCGVHRMRRTTKTTTTTTTATSKGAA
jgi:hypothetical protein